MIDVVLKIIAPHYCYGCSKAGSCLCGNCKNHITDEPFTQCMSCLKPSYAADGLCRDCHRSYAVAWCAGAYEGPLKECIKALKFQRCQEAASTLAELLNMALPELPQDIVVTYVPTTSSHRRQRGYDQAQLIAKSFARKRKLKTARTLGRINNARQLGASAKQRWINASLAYAAYSVEPKTYLLIDDVMTSGATLECASKALLKAGAEEVWVACLARQALD